MRPIAMMILAGCLGAEPEVEPLPQAVRTVEVRQGPVEEGRRYLAEVVPRRSVRVLAQVGGTVSALPVDDGALASEGAVLVSISAPDVGARVSRVAAERRRAEQSRDHACAMAETDRVLAATGDVSAIRLDTSNSQCATAGHAVEAAKAGEAEAIVASARSAERAPFDGQVLDTLVEVGQTVMPGMALIQFGSEAHELLVRVPEGDLVDIDLGALAVGELGRGTVTHVGGWAKGPGRVVEVRVSLDHPDPARVGRAVPLRLVVDACSDCTSVPLEAVGEDADGTYVLVVEDAEVDRRAVTLGPVEAGWVAVEPSLPTHTQVVVGDLESVDRVRPVLAVRVGS